MSAGAEEILYDVRGRVALITYNRPDRLNAWTPTMGAAYVAALDRASDDPGVRAIVVTGAGRGFCSGADLSQLQGLGEGDGVRAGSGDRDPHLMEPAVPKPVIAAVNGACVGLGLVRAVHCDVRFAAAGATFGTVFSRRGLVAEYGLSLLLPRLVGAGRATELLLSGRMFEAAEAERIGLVHRVVDGDVVEAAMAYAEELATWCSPASLRDIKAQLLRDVEPSLEEVWQRTAPLMLASFERPDLLEALAAHQEKRPPDFPPV